MVLVLVLGLVPALLLLLQLLFLVLLPPLLLQLLFLVLPPPLLLVESEVEAANKPHRAHSAGTALGVPLTPHCSTHSGRVCQ